MHLSKDIFYETEINFEMKILAKAVQDSHWSGKSHVPTLKVWVLNVNDKDDKLSHVLIINLIR